VSEADSSKAGHHPVRKKDLLGIVNSPEVYGGPRIVQIDLTNNCNTDCIACWTHSPLLGDQRFTHPEKGYTLDFPLVQDLIEDLARLGAEEVILAGAGEPFLHPNIMEILELISSRGLNCNIITNGSFLNADVAQLLVEWGVTMLTVSVWAGDGETYARNHPSKSPRVFEKLVEDLERLASLKAAGGKVQPIVKLTNVISAYNAHNIREILATGMRVGAEQIEFTTVDIVDGKTDILALRQDDVASILQALDDAQGWREYTTVFNGGEGEAYGWFLPTSQGFVVNGSKMSLTCRAGIEVPAFTICHDERNVVFGYPSEVCAGCEEDACPIDRANPFWALRPMETFNMDTFLRRVKTIASVETSAPGVYDLHYIDTIPCTVGWVYTRVLVDGTVIPCCRGVKKPLGNLHEKPFGAIWTDEAYREFRHKALTLKKSDPYFEPIGCYKMCDNLSMIQEVAHRLEQLSETDRAALRSEARGRSPLTPD
jgi:MoaA/NifB/PqqE/SkfB family radical SAM enzyme